MKKITVCEPKCGLHFLKTNVTMEKQPFEDVSPINRIQTDGVVRGVKSYWSLYVEESTFWQDILV